MNFEENVAMFKEEEEAEGKKKKTAISRKIRGLIHLMGKLAAGEVVYAKDEELQEELGVSYETLSRYLRDLREIYTDIIKVETVEVKDGWVRGYRLVDKGRDVSDVLRYFVEYGEESLDWLIFSVNIIDPSLHHEFDEEDRRKFEEIMSKQGAVYRFATYPFENTSEGAMRTHFNILKRAVRDGEYRRITRIYKGERRTEEVACLKIVFSDGNWYLAAVSADEKLPKEERFMLIRIAFIRHIDEWRDKFPKKLRVDYQECIENIQNAMTLCRPFKTARILASKNVAQYFQKGMKPFFPSQKFVKTNEDGTVEFTIDYTQPLEILPFIKRWAPALTIVEPMELKKEMAEAMKAAWLHHSENGK